MAPTTQVVRQTGAAARFIDSRLAIGQVAFPLADLVKETGLSVTAAKSQLLRLGELVVRPSAKHQFFLIVTPEHRAMGGPPPSWWLDDYFKWLGHPYYLALQSAATAYGSSPQAIQVTQVMSDTPRREVCVGRLRVQFFVKRDVERTATQPLTGANAPLRVSSPEATAFDLITYASRIGGIGRAAETLFPLIPLIQAAQLKHVLQCEARAATAQRLGYLLDKAGNTELAQVVHASLPKPLPLVRLTSSSPRSPNMEIDTRWRIIDNSFDLL
jgi:hypothetical protein